VAVNVEKKIFECPLKALGGWPRRIVGYQVVIIGRNTTSYFPLLIRGLKQT
jgi:hypothetical protein